jgi:uncharacterized protein YggU (UPF0235/DUF167 family)
MKDECAGPECDLFAVRIPSPPVHGRANEHLRRFLARAFGVPRSSIVLPAGSAVRRKRRRIRAPRKLPAAVADL